MWPDAVRRHEGERLAGGTVIRGQIVMRDDECQGAPIGRTVPFLDTGAS